MKFGSVCSGIEAASVAWNPLGWKAQWFSEIEPFPCAVLKHHYPDTPNLGDMTKYAEWPEDEAHAIDLLCGGTPCQSFSVAGLRKGLDDPRGNLMLTFGAIAAKYRPRWLVLENVPGVLSSNGGRDFGSFLGLLGVLGYGFAYRVLDARYFGCAIPRPRVFAVGHSGADWRAPAAVLFERKAFEDRPEGATERPRLHTLSTQNTGSRNARGNVIVEEDGMRGMTPLETERAMGFPDGYTDLTQAPLYARTATTVESGYSVWNHAAEISGNAGASERRMCFMQRSSGASCGGPRSSNGESSGDSLPSMQHQVARHRGHELDDARSGIPGKHVVPDGPRYKALGNSWAVPNVRWIGQRLQQVDQIIREAKDAA